MIYLITPYSNPNPAVMEARFEAVTKKAAELLNRGDFVYSPITHRHPIAVRHALPRDSNFWKDYNIHVLSKCTVLIVVELDGWLLSEGDNAEIKQTLTWRMKVVYVQP